MRAGRAASVNLDADPPFGVMPHHHYRVQTLPLEPGDRLLFLTDGILERNAAQLDIHALVESRADQHPRGAVQHLMAAVLEASGGGLQDDATALCVDWHGGPERERNSSAGADRSRPQTRQARRPTPRTHHPACVSPQQKPLSRIA